MQKNVRKMSEKWALGMKWAENFNTTYLDAT